MKALLKNLVWGLILLSVTSIARADVLLEAGLHFGGDELASATFTSGSTASIDAGGFISLSIGNAFDISDNLEGRITLGWKFDTIDATNGSVDWQRFPLNALLLYKHNDWRFGGGLTYHINPELTSSGAASEPDVKFDDALGFMGEIDYFFSPTAYVGAQFTVIEYDTIPNTQVNDVSVDGNSAGVVVGVRF